MKTLKMITLSMIATMVMSGGAMADVDGAKLFKKKCGTCHSLTAGAHKVGPSLHKIIGRQAGSTDFTKYKALRGSNVVWNAETIDGWITNPKAFIGKSTAMTVKVKKKKDRQAIIDYLIGSTAD